MLICSLLATAGGELGLKHVAWSKHTAWLSPVKHFAMYALVMATNDPQVNFRLPAELRDRLKAAADDKGRTLTAEIVYRLQESFSHPQGLVGRELVSDVLTHLLDSGIIEFTEGGSGLMANLKGRLQNGPGYQKPAAPKKKA